MGGGTHRRRGSGQGSVWFAVAAATGGLVAAIGTSIAAHDRALEREPSKADLPPPALSEHPDPESVAAHPEASTTLPASECAFVTRAR